MLGRKPSNPKRPHFGDQGGSAGAKARSKRGAASVASPVQQCRTEAAKLSKALVAKYTSKAKSNITVKAWDPSSASVLFFCHAVSNCVPLLCVAGTSLLKHWLGWAVLCIFKAAFLCCFLW